MQEEKLYEYAVILLVPRVEREEFFNIGLVMFAKRSGYIRVSLHVCPKKFELINNQLDFNEINQTIENFIKIANGDKDGGLIARLDVPERFRWLTAVRSSVIQTSRPHPGKTYDLDATFERLFEELVK